MQTLPRRQDIPLEDTWNLNHLFESPEALYAFLEKTEKDVQAFLLYKKKTFHVENDLEAIAKYEEISIAIDWLSAYASLALSVDFSNQENQRLADQVFERIRKMQANLSFFQSVLTSLSLEELEYLRKTDKAREAFYRRCILQKNHKLSAEVEESLAYYSHLFFTPADAYDTLKQVDMYFEPLEYKGKTYPMSFVLFENDYQASSDTEFRRLAFQAFSKTLRRYGHSIALFYQQHIKTDKVNAQLRKYSDVFQAMLSAQEVEPTLYHQHLDYLLEHFAPLMQRFVRLIQKRYKLEKLTFSDLKAPLFPEMMPSTSKEEARELCEKSLAFLGEAYLEKVKKIFERRQIDWALNEGKSTGGFCCSPYRKPGYILFSWNGWLSEVFTLIHEIGHCVHFDYAHAHQAYFNVEPSLYLIEAPSTINELFLTEHLLQHSSDEKLKAFVIASMFSNTYYHNMVTHLIEALYQREVYFALEKGESFSFDTFSHLMKKAHQSFWGDCVDLEDTAELTWMRQPHYYAGFYPYTYSAGLTLGTCMAQRICYGSEEEKEKAKQLWLEALSSGAQDTPAQFMQKLGLSIEKQDALKETMVYLDKLLTQLENYIEKEALEENKK